jgi:hypothetical protein
MRIVIGDLHIDCEEKYFQIQKVFFDWIIEKYGNKGYSLDLLGDVLDKRRTTNNSIIDLLQNDFEKLSNNFIDIRILIGNHDVYTSHSLDNNNILKNLFKHISNIEVIEKITMFDDLIYFPFTFNDSDEFKNIRALKNKSSKFLLGHFEINELYPNGCIESQPLKFFEKFHYTFSGHYHTPYEIKNFKYIGTPFELQFNSKNIDAPVRGVYILNEHDFSYEFVEYPYYQNFITYNIESIDDYKNMIKELDVLNNKNVRILIENNIKNQITTELKSIDSNKNNIKISSYDKNINTENEIEDIKSISFLNPNELQEVIFKLIDINYEFDDINDLKNYTKELLNNYGEI